eukprot:PITA_25706
MPFGLKNARETFQQAMDIAFAKEIHDFLVIYLDDLTVFSKSDQQHLDHLKQVFLKCRQYGISLNPKNSLFGLEEGKLMGHIISKDGIRIDTARVEAILQILHPRNVKELQAFLGKINFLRRFISNLAKLIKLLNNMLKKDAKVKWIVEAKQAFEEIKMALTRTPILTSQKFDRDFIIFSFASEHTIAVVLLQKDDERCKRKALPLPLRPISTEKPFQQWGLDFIGEIHPPSSGQQKWTLTATDYFTKWIEAIPCSQANDKVIIGFLEINVLSRFGCLEKIITDNAAAFKSTKMISLCNKYHITLGHSTAYYPQDKLTTKKSIETSPYELVYGLEVVFPSSLGIPVMKLLQEAQVEPNYIQTRINQTIHLQQTRKEVYQRSQIVQEKLKKIFDKRTKAEDFYFGDKVLRWDSRREDKGKHGKFDFLWKGPFIIQALQGNNTYFLKNLDNTETEGPVNG